MAGNRSIFEEVGEGAAQRRTPRGGMIEGGRPKGARRAIRIWLMVIFAMVAAMVAVGGLTRLTDSGLSITQWNPIMGALPPLTTADWMHQFDLYKLSPQYKILNHGMELSQFKVIFWWEWSHRNLGRMVGMVWGIGFLFFWLTKRIPPGYTSRLLWLGFLGGLQGLIGWWMVSSGLHGRMITVASYRLATHLGLAFIILGFSAWYIFLLGRKEAELIQARRARDQRMMTLGSVLVGMVFVQLVLGALTAGIDAGRYFPTWPDMNGRFFPADAFQVANGPWYLAFFENAGLVQFDHRIWAYALVTLALVSAFVARRSAHGSVRFAFTAVAGWALVQMTLGIFTALYAAPLDLASVHQLGAIVLWVLVLRARNLAQFPRVGSIRKGTA
ncbi:heme A synthase [Defluviimonas sp. 20V17]|uniref:Heme A synthase n=1 Tax=Allgaiera indica TaxID=765699 RepID=A0AAN4ZZR3_9RHOB|nr:COX15/CtaA family protein [Allgaiera indica]KDB02983.1 heme A synthase [Defluviimonas sp. 20V17]GHE00726.1 heme A synthase [Allgaiera indica]SDW69297.1 cytochrome c oxidase assembly protein subunit 15 [Allgaiera indica]